jgi:hypothetical protein
VDTRDDKTVHRLIVTGPARDRLYARFRRLYWGRSDVEVVMDRRSGERRRRGAPAPVERRNSERRRAEDVWVVPPDPEFRSDLD